MFGSNRLWKSVKMAMIFQWKLKLKKPRCCSRFLLTGTLRSDRCITKDILSYPNFCPMGPQNLNLLLRLVWSESVISPYCLSLVTLLGFYRPWCTECNFFRDGRSLCIGAATRCFLPRISSRTVLGVFHEEVTGMVILMQPVLLICYL